MGRHWRDAAPWLPWKHSPDLVFHKLGHDVGYQVGTWTHLSAWHVRRGRSRIPFLPPWDRGRARQVIGGLASQGAGVSSIILGQRPDLGVGEAKQPQRKEEEG